MIDCTRQCWRAIVAVGLIGLAGCGGSSTATAPPPAMSLTLGVSSIDLQQDGLVDVGLPIAITNAPGVVSLSVTGLPAEVSAQSNANSGSPILLFSGGVNVPAGNYTATITASSGTQSASQQLTIVMDVVANVSPSVDTTLGVNGVLKEFMSTSFQVAEWDGDYFGGANAGALESTMTAMGPQHIRLQTVSQGVAMSTNTGTSADWSFAILDQTVQPVLASGDHSPEFQIATAPTWMCFANGQLDVADHVNDFAAYAANLVRYYNKGGFNWGGQHFQSPSGLPITWWGIFNEPNGNGISAADYVTIYNTVVPAMLAVDPTIKLSAIEYADYGLGTGDGGDPMTYLPTFVAAANAGGASAQVNIVSTHFYSSCNQTNPDAQLMASVPQFAANVSYFYQELKTRPDLANVPVWVTENNVNADYQGANGMSTCNPGQTFVDDHRGTSAFFAAWRPYVFSALGKVGNQALYHWAYDGDQQYGEVDPSGNTYLSYWVDKTLAALYPSTPASPGPQILQLAATDTATVETLATKNADGSVVVMVDNHAVASPADNNGAGAPRTVVVDVSALGSFSSESVLAIDATTNPATGPAAAVNVGPSSLVKVPLSGYGVAWLVLKP